MAKKLEIIEIRNNEELEIFKEHPGSVIKARGLEGIELMKYHIRPNRTDMLLIGRGGDKSISTIKINRDNVLPNEDGSLSFKEPYERDDVPYLKPEITRRATFTANAYDSLDSILKEVKL